MHTDWRNHKVATCPNLVASTSWRHAREGPVSSIHGAGSPAYLEESRHPTLLNESQCSEDSILPHMELLNQMPEEDTLEEAFKPYKVQIQAQKNLIADMHKQSIILEMCLEAKNAEVDSLRQAKNQEKISNKETMEKLLTDLTAANLELEEYRGKDKEIKATKQLVAKQKKEINKMKMSYDQLIKNKTELEKTLLKSNIPAKTPERHHQQRKPQDVGQDTQGGGSWKKIAEKKIAVKQAQKPTKTIAKETANPPAQATKLDHHFPSLPNVQNISVIVNGKTRKESKPQKNRKLFIAGDSNVRGLSDLVNPPLMTREVAVRGGARIQDAAIKAPIDAKRLEQGSIMVYNFGTNDLKNPDYKRHIANLVNTLKQEAKHLTVGITSVPEQADRTLNERSKNINQILEQACRDSSNIKLIKTSYQMSDLTRNGLFLNLAGRVKLASSINKFVTCHKNYV